MNRQNQDNLTFYYGLIPGDIKLGAKIRFALIMAFFWLAAYTVAAILIYRGSTGWLALFNKTDNTRIWVNFVQLLSGKHITIKLADWWQMFFQSSLMLLFGLIVFLIPLLIVAYGRSITKLRFKEGYFDLTTRRFILKDKYHESGFIPFGEITSFQMRVETVTRQADSTNKYIYDRYTHFYVVYFTKKDGAWWDLFYAVNEKDARERLDYLLKNVDLSGNLSGPEKETILPRTIKKAIREGKTVFSWKNNLNIFLNLMGFFMLESGGLMFLSLTGIFLSKIASGSHTPFPVLFITTFIALILMFFGFLLIFKNILASGQYSLEISREKVTLKHGNTLVKSLAFSEIARTQFSYDIFDRVFNGWSILVLPEELAKKVDSLKYIQVAENRALDELNTFAKIKEYYKVKEGLMQIPLDDHKLMEILRFEKVIDITLSEWGSKVL